MFLLHYFETMNSKSPAIFIIKKYKTEVVSTCQLINTEY